ncbi:MAG: TonB-dependent siderophore receptor [Rhodoferax sp.]|nr:TonB-dependent siderophore receptor [Rhodoferax sp.]
MAIHRLRKAAVATAIGTVFLSPLWAQTQPTKPATLTEVTVSAKAAPVLDTDRADVGGWGIPLAQTPQSITVLGTDFLGVNATSSLSQAIKLDASLADSYNTTGYLENLSVRGFTLNSDGNTLRNGLAVSSYTPIALENKERIEVLKGVSGLQSGVSAPGGLLNLVSKAPTADAFTTLSVGTNDESGSKLHLDTNTRLGAVGLRVNLVHENLHPAVDSAKGKRELASVAIALPVSADTTLAADLEYHHKVQPSVPGLGLLDSNGDYVGDALPARIQPRLNLNNQSWSLPMEATSSIAQMMVKHRINRDWQAQAGWSAQRTVIDDRLAFPDGCSNAPQWVYPGLCSNGDVDMYDFRSEGEVRTVRSWDAQLSGTLVALGLPQQLRFGFSGRESTADLAPMQAYSYVGFTNIYQPVAVPADPALTYPNTDSQEQTTEAFAAISTQWTPTVRSFMGVRASRLERSSVKSDGSESLALSQSVSTPWAGLAWTAAPGVTWYASWGQGVELDAVPNRPTSFVNAGQVLPALKSEQTEMGVKWQALDRLLVTAAAFTIDKPFADDVADAGGLMRRVGGGKTARHSGLELGATGALGSQWSVQATVSFLSARWVAALTPGLVDKSVTNVPKTKASLFADYKVQDLPGFSVHGLLVAEGEKGATADGSTTLPASWQLDAGARYRHRLGGQSLVWNLQVENLTDRSYWREAPTQSWGATYLFAAASRTVHASATLEF